MAKMVISPDRDLLNIILFILILFIFIFFGWILRWQWKNNIFLFLKRRGREGEITSINILKRNGYKIIGHQIRLEGHIFIDGRKSKFELRPDFLVEKDGIRYLAEIKTGEVASPKNRNTRRQLHEYVYYGGYDVILLVDPDAMSITRISFRKP